MSSNLPPGVTASMLPGNRPEDMAYEHLHEAIDNDGAENNMSDQDIFVAWKMGLSVYLQARKLKAVFLHDGPEPDICNPNPEDFEHFK